MTIKRPTHGQLAEIVEGLGMSMGVDEIQFYLENLQGVFDRYDLIDRMPDEIPAVSYPRTPGYRPDPSDNPHNAW